MRSLIVLCLLLALGALGCEGQSVLSSQTANASPAKAAPEEGGKVAKIVFVGKEHACDCTRRAVEEGWSTLQGALGAPSKVPVERIQIDTESDKAGAYQRMRPMMVLPALYFLDSKGGLVEMIQGEFTKEQIALVLQTGKSSP